MTVVSQATMERNLLEQTRKLNEVVSFVVGKEKNFLKVLDL